MSDAHDGSTDLDALAHRAYGPDAEPLTRMEADLLRERLAGGVAADPSATDSGSSPLEDTVLARDRKRRPAWTWVFVGALPTLAVALGVAAVAGAGAVAPVAVLQPTTVADDTLGALWGSAESVSHVRAYGDVLGVAVFTAVLDNSPPHSVSLRCVDLRRADDLSEGGSLGGACTLESGDVPLVFDLNPPYQDFFRPPTTGLTELGDDMLRVIVRPDETVEVYRVGPPATATPADG